MSEPTSTTTETTEAQATATEPAAQPATDWESEAKKWEKRSKDNFAKAKDLEARLAEVQPIVEASKTAEQRQAEELSNWQTQAEQWRKTAIGSRIEALAAGSFADPSDAVTALADKNYLDAGGQIDEAQIRADLDEVLERKPHWRRAEQQQTGPRVPAPNLNQGNSGGAAQSDPAAVFGAIVRNQLGGG